jgi:hypothetical protein
VGDDPQGLKSLAFTGASGMTCKMGDTAYEQDGDLAGPQYQNKAVAGQTTTTRLWLPTYIDFSNYACDKHYKITSLSIALWVVATNYGGFSATSPAATFVYNP